MKVKDPTLDSACTWLSEPNNALAHRSRRHPDGLLWEAGKSNAAGATP